MLVTLVRGFILYFVIILFMRFMGKHQLGELQPTELVITILISEIAAMPMEDNENPIINSIIAVALLSCLEIINSVIIMKSTKIRYFLEGKPAIIINEGKLNQKKLKDLRFTADDILDQLRQKDIFNLDEVDYAVVETNGNLSIMKSDNQNNKKSGLPVLVVNDGKIIKSAIKDADLNEKTIEKILKKEKVDKKEVLVLLLDKFGNYTLIRKDN